MSDCSWIIGILNIFLKLEIKLIVAGERNHAPTNQDIDRLNIIMDVMDIVSEGAKRVGRGGAKQAVPTGIPVIRFRAEALYDDQLPELRNEQSDVKNVQR